VVRPAADEQVEVLACWRDKEAGGTLSSRTREDQLTAWTRAELEIPAEHEITLGCQQTSNGPAIGVEPIPLKNWKYLAEDVGDPVGIWRTDAPGYEEADGPPVKRPRIGVAARSGDG
jgi:hypothetical protein